MSSASLDDKIQAVKSTIAQYLSDSFSRVRDLFAAWDVDQSGTIDRDEFYSALLALGIDCSRIVANEVFDSVDVDRSDSIDYSELQTFFPRPQVQLDEMLQVGACGEIALVAANPFSLRTAPAGPKRVLGASAELDLDAADAEELAAQLRELLSENWVRVRDLVRLSPKAQLSPMYLMHHTHRSPACGPTRLRASWPVCPVRRVGREWRRSDRPGRVLSGRDAAGLFVREGRGQ